MSATYKFARALGWTSMAVGITELFATRPLEEAMGVKHHLPLIRSFAVRELAAGAMILSQPGITSALSGGLWSRVAGDLLDLLALGIAAKSSRNRRGLASITAIVLAVTGLDILIAGMIQNDLHRASVASKAARQRVDRRPAIPKMDAQQTPVMA